MLLRGRDGAGACHLEPQGVQHLWIVLHSSLAQPHHLARGGLRRSLVQCVFAQWRLVECGDSAIPSLTRHFNVPVISFFFPQPPYLGPSKLTGLTSEVRALVVGLRLFNALQLKALSSQISAGVRRTSCHHPSCSPLQPRHPHHRAARPTRRLLRTKAQELDDVQSRLVPRGLESQEPRAGDYARKAELDVGSVSALRERRS